MRRSLIIGIADGWVSGRFPERGDPEGAIPILLRNLRLIIESTSSSTCRVDNDPASWFLSLTLRVQTATFDIKVLNPPDLFGLR